MPPDTPVTNPLAGFMPATAGDMLLHVPPVVILLKEVVLPWQTVFVPVIEVSMVTVTVVSVTQPAGVV